MNKKTILLFLSSIFAYGCVSSNIPTVNPTRTPQPSNSPTLTPTSTPTVSPVVTPLPSSSLIPSASVMPTVLPTQNPTISPTPVTNVLSVVSLGLNNPYKKITDSNTEDYQKESREVSDNLVEIKSDFVIVDLKQELIDLDYRSEIDKLRFQFYDNTLANIKDKNIKIYFRINYKKSLSASSYPTFSRYQEYLREVVQRYKDYNIAWIVGDSINDTNSTPVSTQEYITFLRASYEIIKSVSSNQVFMGSLVQSEIFGKPVSYLADNLLSYINLGADKYSDGFIFRVYSLDIQNKYVLDSVSNFNGTDYKLIGDYYSYITDILKMKNIQNKKLILETGTYGPDTVNNVTQTEQQQANDIFRRVVYANSLGFSSVFLPEYYDKTGLDKADFYRKIGLINPDNTGFIQKKTSYWMSKFISEKLGGATFKSRIENLPSNIQGYLYTKANKNYYILWNEDINFNGTVRLNINTNLGNLLSVPTEGSTNGSSLNFQTNSDNVYNVPFYPNPLNPRIIETDN